MEKKDNYTIAELFEKAKNDSSWEENARTREILCKNFKRKLRQLT